MRLLDIGFGDIKKPVVGMIHVCALPGTYKSDNDMNLIIADARQEAVIYKEAEVDGVMLENMHDVPYLNRSVGPEITAVMTVVAHEVKKILRHIPLGIQVLAGANKEALAIAKAANLSFIRAEGFIFAHIADEGLMDSCAGELLRYSKQIGADNVLIFTDIKKKHSSHSMTADVDIVETAKAAEFFLSDGVVVTGSSTGLEANHSEVEKVRSAVNIPVLVGSGITVDNIECYWNMADAFVVGSHFKKDGFWENDLDSKRIRKFMNKVFELRSLK